MSKKIKYEDYESVVDTIITAGGLALKLHVSLVTKNKNNIRQPIYKEFTYNSNKYSTPTEVVTVHRSISAFLSLDQLWADEGMTKGNVMIRMQDMYYVREKFNEVDKIIRSAFKQNKSGKLELAKVFDPVNIILYGTTVEIIPVVINNENHNIQERGIRIALQNYDMYNYLTADQFMGFKYAIDTIDIYGASLSVLNYIGKPENGTNNMSINEEGRFVSNSPFK